MYFDFRKNDALFYILPILILLNSPLVTDLIQRNEIGSLKEAMRKGKEMDMQSFDMALYDL
jgi:twitching motility protein PilU